MRSRGVQGQGDRVHRGGRRQRRPVGGGEPENTWAKCLTVAQLKTMWAPESEGKIKNWNQVDKSFPDVPLALSALALIQARSTTSLRRSTVKRARAAPTTAHRRTTT